MINYKIDGDLFVVEADNTVYTFLKPTYPRQYKALNVSNDSFQIIALGNNERLYYGKIADTTIEGVVYSDINDFILQMNKVVFAGASSAIPTPYITSTLPMIDPLGVFVIKNTYSDGTVTYTLQDGSTYLGDTTLLLPYEKGGEKQLILPITDFVESGAYDYFLPKTIHGIEIINSVEVGSSVDTLSAITNYTIAPNGDLTISTNAQLTSEIVRITGNY